MPIHPFRLATTLAAAVVAAVALQAGAARGDAPPCTPHGDEAAYTLTLRALTGPEGGDLTIGVATDSTCAADPATLKKAQVKTFSLDGSLERTRNLTDLALENGATIVDLGDVHRGQAVAVEALVQTGQPARTYVVRSETTVLLRPDLTVTAVRAPQHALRTRGFEAAVEISELNGDVGASATLTFDAGGTPTTGTIDIPAAGHVTVPFPLSFATAGTYVLVATISEATPHETDTTNNAGRTSVEITDVDVDQTQTLVQSLVGYGGQFNQNVYADISNPPVNPQNVLELENKVVALEPQFVRVFFHNSALEARFADRMASFVRTVQLAQRTGATINVTWQGGGTTNPPLFMRKFADVLIDLLQNRGIPALWVTIQNGVNSTKITPEQNEQTYRLLDGYLRDAGLRDRVRFMGGDLVADKQRIWFDYMATHMADILDAWSVHIAWDYWDTPKIEKRLTDIRAIWEQEPASGRKPLYVSEYDVRGRTTCGGQPQVDPGTDGNCTPLSKTNINAFQHGWFTLRAAQVGFVAASKWDSYYGRYDNTPQAFYMIGSPLEGWPLNPVYSVTRLLTMTVKPGWSVVGTDAPATTKLVTAYAGPNGELTVAGLDKAGGSLESPSSTVVSYSIGGVAPSTEFKVVYWNRDGSGGLSEPERVTSDAAGVVHVDAPLTSMFALTTRSL